MTNRTVQRLRQSCAPESPESWDSGRPSNNEILCTWDSVYPCASVRVPDDIVLINYSLNLFILFPSRGNISPIPVMGISFLSPREGICKNQEKGPHPWMTVEMTETTKNNVTIDCLEIL